MESMISCLSTPLQTIARKVYDGIRISSNECEFLYQHDDLGFLGILASHIKEKRHGKKVFFNRNIHIEPTNLCVFDCKFCSYSRLLKQKEDPDAWIMTEEEIIEKISSYTENSLSSTLRSPEGGDRKFPSGDLGVYSHENSITEVHIVGGVHPKMTLEYFASLLKKIKAIRPNLHVKAFTAVELEYMCRKAGMSYRQGLQYLKDNGLQSLPGGGAEIFDEELRKKICADKCTSKQWLEIHKTAHELEIPSNATMLYGHIENYSQRVDHMSRLRDLQDDTHGFNAFIPLKFRNQNNQMSGISEVSVIEDLKNYAIARIFLDNIPHIKAYWPMIGKETARLSLQFGVDDVDGTIDDTTRIYSMAGVEDQHPAMTTSQMTELIRSAGKIPIERDTLYRELEAARD